MELVQNQLSLYTEEDRYPDIFRETTRFVKDGKILSFGCSSGKECESLSKKYFPLLEVHGIDIDKKTIEENIIQI
mgnify:CR=1 FL=1